MQQSMGMVQLDAITYSSHLTNSYVFVIGEIFVKNGSRKHAGGAKVIPKSHCDIIVWIQITYITVKWNTSVLFTTEIYLILAIDWIPFHNLNTIDK